MLTYYPARYMLRAKFGVKVGVDHLIFNDYVISLLITWDEFSLQGFASVTFLFLSVMSVYDIGYFENDTVAAKRERAPHLRPEAEEFRDIPMEQLGWGWALFLGGLGCVVHCLPNSDATFIVTTYLSFCLWLLATRVVFYVYNRNSEQSRLKWYPFLQIAKTFWVSIVFTLNSAGVALALSQVFMRWVNYIVYRQKGDFGSFNREWFRLIVFVILFFPIVKPNIPTSIDKQGWVLPLVMLVWCIFRSCEAGIKHATKNFLNARLKKLSARLDSRKDA
jgi:hypothetical protein